MSSLPERCQGPAGTQGHGEWQFLRDRVTWNDGELALRGAVLGIGRARVAGGPVTPERETISRRGGAWPPVPCWVSVEARPTPPRPRGSPVARSLGPCQPLRTNTRVRQQEMSHVIVPQVLRARHPAPLSQ